MERCKLKNKLKKIFILIMCITTLIFTMPVKSSAGVVESLSDAIMWLFDLPMKGLNLFVAETNVSTNFDINLIGIDINTGTFGSLYNFEVTPDRIFSAGRVETVLVPADYLDNGSILGGVESKTGEYGVYEMINGVYPKTSEQTPIYTCEKDSEDYTKLYEIADKNTNILDTEKLKEFLKNKNINNDIQSQYMMIPTDTNEMFDNDNQEYVATVNVKEEDRTVLPLLDANFFSDANSEDKNNSANILKSTISAIYRSLATFSILVMLVVLLYIGIRIIISSATEKAKYKESLIGWVIGLCLIFCMHFIMSFISQINGLIINTLGASKSDDYYITVSQLDGGWKELVNKSSNAQKYFIASKLELDKDGRQFQVNSRGETTTEKWKNINGGNPTVKVNARLYDIKDKKDNEIDYALYRCNIVEYMRTCISVDTDYVQEIRYKSNGEVSTYTETSGNNKDEEKIRGTTFFAYLILYAILVLETVTFCFKYIKRVIYLAFLTMIAPLISLMYPMDKVGDGKAQTFNMWFKEYLFNTLLQPLHLLLYTIFIVGAKDLAHDHYVYAIGFYAFMLFAEGFFKKMFGFDKANVPKGLGSPLAYEMSRKLFDGITGLGPPGSPGNKKDGATDSSLGGKIKRAKSKFDTVLPGGLGSLTNGTPASSGGSQSENSSSAPNSSGIEGFSMPSGSGNSSNKVPKASGRIGRGLGALKNSVPLGLARQGVKGIERGIARKITGGKTGSLKSALKGNKLDILKTAGKGLGKTANRALGTAVGTMAGLTSGVIGAAVTGDSSYITKGITTGAAAGYNRSKNAEEWLSGIHEENKRMLASEDATYAAKLSRDDFLKNNYKYFDSLSDSERKEVMETLDTFTPYMDFKDTSDLEAMNNIYQQNKGTMNLEEMYNIRQDASTWGDLTDSSNMQDYEEYLMSEELKKVDDGQISVDYSEAELDDAINERIKIEQEETDKKYKEEIQIQLELGNKEKASELDKERSLMNKKFNDPKKYVKENPEIIKLATTALLRKKLAPGVKEKSRAARSYQQKMK